MAPLTKTRRLMRVGLEGTKGVAVTGSAYIIAYDPVFEYTGEFVENKGTVGYSGHSPGSVTNKRGKASFTTDLFGDGSAGFDSALEILFQCSGHAVAAGVATPVTSPAAQVTATLELFEDGKLKRIPGASGNLTIEMTTDGKVQLKWEFEGNWLQPVDEGLPAPTLPTQKAMVFSSGSFSVDGAAVVVSKCELSTNNQLAWQNNHYVITDRDPQINFDPEQKLVTDYDFEGKWSSESTLALAAVATNGTDKATISMPLAQIRDLKPGEREGILIYDITSQCNRTADNDYSITIAAA